MLHRDIDRYIDVRETPVLSDVPLSERERIAQLVESVPPPWGNLAARIAKVSYERDCDTILNWAKVLRIARFHGSRALLRVRDQTGLFPSSGEYPILQWKRDQAGSERQAITFWILHRSEWGSGWLEAAVAQGQPRVADMMTSAYVPPRARVWG